MKCFELPLSSSESNVFPTVLDSATLSPEEVSSQERFLLLSSNPLSSVPLLCEPSLDAALRLSTPTEATALYRQLVDPGRPYVVLYGSLRKARFSGELVSGGKGSVLLWIKEDATPVDVIKGYFHAALIRKLADQPQLDETKARSPRSDLNLATTRLVDELFPIFRDSLRRKGWTLDHHFLAEDNSRINLIKSPETTTR